MRTLHWLRVLLILLWTAQAGRLCHRAWRSPEVYTKNDLLLGFCRLRIVPESHRSEIRKNSAGIRELHVYCQAVPLGESGDIQHKGLGRQLMAEAERIAKDEFNCKKILVISGVGAREYYYNLGYKLDGVYVSKWL